MTIYSVHRGSIVELTQQANGSCLAQVTTANIECRSVTKAHFGHYVGLLRDEITGTAWSKEKTKRYVDIWTNCWKAGDPISAFALFERGSGLFIGHAMPIPSETTAECVLHEKYREKGYEEEVASALVKHYLPVALKIKQTASKVLLASKL